MTYRSMYAAPAAPNKPDLCRASRDARLAALGPFMKLWGSGRPGIELGLDVTAGFGPAAAPRPGKCGSPAALTWADKKAAWAA